MTGTQTFEIPTQLREFAEKGVEQTGKAFESFFGMARKAVDGIDGTDGTLQSSAKTALTKSIEFAEQAVTAQIGLAQKLVHARDLQEGMQLQAEFVRTQFAALQNQAGTFGNLAQTVAR